MDRVHIVDPRQRHIFYGSAAFFVLLDRDVYLIVALGCTSAVNRRSRLLRSSATTLLSPAHTERAGTRLNLASPLSPVLPARRLSFCAHPCDKRLCAYSIEVIAEIGGHCKDLSARALKGQPALHLAVQNKHLLVVQEVRRLTCIWASCQPTAATKRQL